MPSTAPLVFFIDVDNTLLDNDRVIADLGDHLQAGFGVEMRKQYFDCLETLRTECGFVDYLGALQRLRGQHIDTQALFSVGAFLLDYPFADRLFPQALDVLADLRRRGQVVILSDGDAVFQPRKIRRSGLWDALQGQVLIYIHKEAQVREFEQHYPAAHYVMIDDKLRILAALKPQLGERLTTVYVRQGHYAHDPQHTDGLPAADLAVDKIGDLLGHAWPELQAPHP